jgi:hypothetical protein
VSRTGKRTCGRWLRVQRGSAVLEGDEGPRRKVVRPALDESDHSLHLTRRKLNQDLLSLPVLGEEVESRRDRFGHALLCGPIGDGQTLDAQIAELKAAGATKLFAEKQSGARSDRPQLRKALAALGEGDVLMVTRLDRLARSTRDLLNVLLEVAQKVVESDGRTLAVSSIPLS